MLAGVGPGLLRIARIHQSWRASAASTSGTPTYQSVLFMPTTFGRRHGEDDGDAEQAEGAVAVEAGPAFLHGPCRGGRAVLSRCARHAFSLHGVAVRHGHSQRNQRAAPADSSTVQATRTPRWDQPGQCPAAAWFRAWAAAPNGVYPTIRARVSGMACTGSQTPAQNIIGKNTADPIAPAIFVVRETAETTAPSARAARTARTSARR